MFLCSEAGHQHAAAVLIKPVIDENPQLAIPWWWWCSAIALLRNSKLSPNLNEASLSRWCPSSSVMKMPPSVTRACTWVCPAVRKTSTAAPTCRPTCPSREAPKKPSGSPQYSAPPNSHKMVILTPYVLFFIYFYFLFNSIWFSSVFSGPSGSSELEGPSRPGVGHPWSITSD